MMGGRGETRLMTNRVYNRVRGMGSISLLLLRECDLRRSDSWSRDVCPGFVA